MLAGHGKRETQEGNFPPIRSLDEGEEEVF